MKRIEYILLCSLLVLWTACEKDTLPMNFSPALKTGEATEIYRMGATLSGSIQKSEGVVVKDCGILLSELQSMAEYTELKVTASDVTLLSVQVKDLQPGKTYYYCTYASSGYSMARGEIKTFTTTESNAPVFSELVMENKDEKSFTVATTILDEGGSDLILCGFCWKLAEENATEPTVEDNVSNVSVGSSAISMRIKDLKPNKNYLVRAYGINAKGVGYGKTIRVLTNNATAPVVSSITPVDSTALSVAVKASILSEGESGVSEIGFCWSAESQEPTTAHLKYDATEQLGHSEFNTRIEGLKPETTYYIRAYAINEHGTGYGDVYMFVSGKAFTVTTLSVDVHGVDIKAYGQVTSGTPNYHHGFDVASNMDELLNRTEDVISVEVHTNLSYNEVDGTFNGDITNLKVNTIYYIRAWFIDSVTQDVIFGNVLEFETEDVPGIYSLQDLIDFRDAKNSGGDLSKWKNSEGVINVFADIDINSVDNWSPIKYIGRDEILEGNGHIISGWKYIGETDFKLQRFGFICTNEGTLNNIKLEDGSIELVIDRSRELSCGALCGYSSGLITNCSTTMSVTVKEADVYGTFVSGICGQLAGENARIEFCINRGNIQGGGYIAGIAAECDANVVGCRNYGMITAGEYSQMVSGIAYCYNFSIIDCANYGTVNGGKATFAGGISSRILFGGKVQNCVNEGVVYSVGETLGGITASLYPNSFLLNCTNNGDISSNSDKTVVGGIVGEILSPNCFYENNINGGTINGMLGTVDNAIGYDNRK
ncbi:fibronectin type III domain-containing protein [Bacteroides cellulosilyticus]|jgi:hypothetical protein|uniref:fibronectin type III domain-containing protein n=1 Tax=Bacteroides cellulosilyticus TaxID=246787 RepID=UPI0011C1B3B0|nr:fibronectin type III domain-containing protein [Bacteroides cellulosilyticus]